jgi:ATP-dependent Lon protease
MEYELTAGKLAKTLKVWEKTNPTNVEIIAEMGKFQKPTDYEFYVFRYSKKVELRQDLFLLSDRGSERIEKLIDGRLTEVRVPNRDAEIKTKIEKQISRRRKEKAEGMER